MIDVVKSKNQPFWSSPISLCSALNLWTFVVALSCTQSRTFAWVARSCLTRLRRLLRSLWQVVWPTSSSRTSKTRLCLQCTWKWPSKNKINVQFELKCVNLFAILKFFIYSYWIPINVKKCRVIELLLCLPPSPLIFGSHIPIFRLWDKYKFHVYAVQALLEVWLIFWCLNFDNASILKYICVFQHFIDVSNLYPFSSSILNSKHVVLYTWLKNYGKWEEVLL